MEPITRTQLDRAQLLAGSVVTGVQYYLAPEEQLDSEAWRFDVAHVAHYGVELTTDWGVLSLVSSEQFTEGGFELELLARSLSDRHRRVQVMSMNDEPRWKGLIGRTVTSAKILWVDSAVCVGPDGKKVHVSHHFDVEGAKPFAAPLSPLALEVHFDSGGKVLLVSGGWNGLQRPITENREGISILWDATCFRTLVPQLARGLKKTWRAR
jgi:hypothetical protein